MKKSVLFGYTALCAAGFIFSARAETVPVVPSVETVKTGFDSFLKSQGLTLDKEITVRSEGDNFVITVPSFEAQVVDQTTAETIQDGKTVQTETLEIVTRTIPERTVHLIRNGSFGDQAQYKMEPATLEHIQAVLKDFLPMLTLSADNFKSELVWVPAYNLISRQSLNTQKFKAAVPRQVDFSADSLVFDMLARSTESEKMDVATSNDAKGIALKLFGVTVAIPTLTQNIQWVGSSVSGDGTTRNLTAETISGSVSAPMVSITAEGDVKPTVTFSTSGKSQIDKDIHVLIDIDHIQIADTLPIPTVFKPTDIRVNMTVSGIDRQQLYKIQQLTQQPNTPDLSDRIEKESVNLVKNATITLNPVEVKNREAGMSVTGTLQNYLNTEGELDQKIDAVVTVTNLDKISPEPKVNETECAAVQKQLSETDISPDMASQFIESACRPKGGILDAWRAYLNPKDRVTAKDGTTTDVFKVHYADDTLTINGKTVDMSDGAQATLGE